MALLGELSVYEHTENLETKWEPWFDFWLFEPGFHIVHAVLNFTMLSSMTFNF